MDSTTTAFHNDNDDDDSQRPKVPTFSAERRTTETPDQFVYKNRLPTNPTNNQQGQWFKNTGYKQTNNAHYNVKLLSDLAGDFSHLLNRTDISDCWLNVNGTYMAVHRCILAARSSTFSAIMSGNDSRLSPDTIKELQPSEKNDKLEISITKASPEIMKQVIIFMYTTECELNETNAYDLHEAAGRYGIKSLKNYTAEFLINHINPKNFVNLIKIADKYRHQTLKNRCIEYFIDHGKEVTDMTGSWTEFCSEHKGIVSELLYWTVHKDKFHEQVERSQLQSQW
ncbi:unnamed protein product [Rotaria sp. Silwood1]|nr:unnamed protein product [Rotaria sp. Silwood1]CAF1108893.1 unnamed protein product [Rotaria sp. Silwood1]CAF3443766.1 unnamed protein product [Rotaria sp. Silwood1]